VGISEIMELNPRITKESEVFSYAYHLVAKEILSNSESVKWEEISLVDFKDRQSTITFSETRGITIDEQDYRVVLDHYLGQPERKRVPFAYLTRLVLLYTRKKLRELKGIAVETKSKSEIRVEKINGVSLLRQIAELLEKDTVEAEIKILKIRELLIEEK
jgi:hypothetical protein